MVISKKTSELHKGFLNVFIDGVTAGYTLGGATVELEQEVSSVNVDDFGSSAVDDIVQGNGAVVTLREAQVTNPNVLQLFVPGTVVTTSGAVTRLEQGAQAGVSLVDTASFQVVLSGSASKTLRQQWIFHVAYVKEGLELEYNNDTQTIAEFPIQVVPDPSKEGATDALYRHETFAK